MLHNPFSTPLPTPAARPTLHLSGLQSLHEVQSPPETFSDSRTHGYQGPSRAVTLYAASSAGGSAISKSPDGKRCVVAGKDSLRILRVSDGTERPASEYKYAIGKGGFRIDASKNYWSGSGLKVDSAMTDVAWCHKAFDTKILTSARNGEILLWDLYKSGSLKYESKKKAHARSINKLSYSSVMPHYCSTGSSDGYLRVWDLRNLSKEFLHIHHSFAIRTVMFSPSILEPLHAITGLDSGSMCRWDLRMGQKGLVERVPLAHTGAILSLDWNEAGVSGKWLASAGLDRTVKVWDFKETQSQTSRKPAYILHASYPVRRVLWRPGYETELAIASYNESAYNPATKTMPSSSVNTSGVLTEFNDNAVPRQNSPGSIRTDIAQHGDGGTEVDSDRDVTQRSGDLIEIWDVRRPWIAKWTVEGSNCEGGVSDMTFADSHDIWVQHPSGAFSQMDLRYCDKPLDSVPRTALTWTPTGSLTFVSDNVGQWEIPYDDVERGQEVDSAEKTGSLKRLGDKRYTPTSQSVGTIFDATDSEEWDAFTFLARSYRMEGADRLTLCELNAETAFETGNYEAGRVWLLLRSLLEDIVLKPSSPPLSHRNSVPGVPHSTSAPATVPTVRKSPHKTEDTRSSSSDPPSLIREVATKRSGGLASVSRAMTPSARSPVSSALSPDVASPGNGKQSALDDESKMRSKSVSVGPADRPRRLSLRRSSSSKTGGSEDRHTSSRSRASREVGEGALNEDSSDEEVIALPPEHRPESMKARVSTESISSPVSLASWARTRVVSSPGLHDDNGWAEDEKEDSVSPASSESESDNSVASTTAARSASLKRPARSRTSTHASVVSSSKAKLKSDYDLQRTDSQSSVLTVMAGGDKSITQGQAGPSESEALAETTSLAPSQRSNLGHPQGISTTNKQSTRTGNEYFVDEQEMRFLEWNRLAIKDAENCYRQTAWNALRKIVDRLAENGDVQLCAMLSCIAPSELGISTWRALQFIEAYLDILSRFRMYEVLAYIRKYTPSVEVRQSTQVQTTVHSTCASCHKPMLQHALGQKEGVDRSWTGFSQCFECKRAAIMCAICHLPVRSTLFVCAVCSHGGHRDCYHRFYMQRPMIELSSVTQDNRGHRVRIEAASEGGSASSPSLGGGSSLPDQSTIKISGHPCAAGCGHYCWTASEKLAA
ncbi:RTC1 [Sanghuangporus weigelae]